jgi:hypothetical protein
MKNQIVSGIRGFSRGLVFVALAASLVLGACEGIIVPPDVEEVNNASYTVPDANGRVRVTVRIPEDAARSFTVNDASGVSNYFEVIFRDRDAMRPIEPYYYSDSKPKGESLNVQLPLEHHFDILLLAGYKAKRVLLGSAYINHKANDEATYSATGEGYLIETGKANIINIAITAITVNPADDFTVTYDGDPVDIERNDDATAIANAETALTAAKTALTSAKAALGVIVGKFTTGSIGINARFSSLDTWTTSDIEPLPGTGTMVANYTTAKAAFDAVYPGGVFTVIDLDDVDNAIGAFNQTTAKIEDAITKIKAAIETFKTADDELIDVIEAANEVLPYAQILDTKAASVPTTNNVGITAAVSGIGSDLATINADGAAGSLLEAVAYAVEAVNKTNEGAKVATGNLAMAIPKQRDTTSGDFEVKVENARLTPLSNAQSTPDVDTLFYAHALTLGFAEQGERSFIDVSTSTPTLAISGDTITTTYTIPREDMPDEDAYGVLYFNTTYYPFSVRDAGNAWYIRDGVDNTKVDFSISGTTIASTPSGSDRTGGAVFVTIGKGGEPFDVNIPVVTH